MVKGVAVAGLSAAIDNSQQVADLPNEDKIALATAALQSLPQEQKQNVVTNVGVLPDQSTANFVWRVIVSTFALGLIVAVITVSGIALGLFPGTTDIQTMLTVFTTTAGFLAGLLSPSPVGRNT
jgi:uncharacterized membrane protein YbhN (UPF0104 family)